MEEHKLLKRKEKALNEGNNNLALSVCTDLAEIYMNQDNYRNAIREYKLIAEIYEAQGSKLDYARANRGLGEAYMGLCDFETAKTHQTIYLDISREEKDKLEEQRALATLGHTYLTRYLNEAEENQKELLNCAYKYFMKSLMVCESLTGISKWDKADMSARLFSNLGVVHESLKNYDKSEELLMKSINICKANDIYEQLQRAHYFLASLYEKRGEHNNAIHQYNLAIETSKKLKNKHSLMCTALSLKAEVLIKLRDLQGAKNSLYKAYKMKSPNAEERAAIERNLKIVVALCQTQDKLLLTGDTNHQELRTLYELMGDGFCHFKYYKTAIEYYQKMLQAATNAGDSGESLAPCYFSLAETYRDDKQYDEAIKHYEKEYAIYKTNLRESLNTLLKICECAESSGAPVREVRAVFERGLNSCKENCDKAEEGRLLSRYVAYLRRKNQHSDAFLLQKELQETGYVPSESDSEEDSPPQNTSNLGDDVSLSNITDISDDSDVEELSVKKGARRRSKNYVVKRNIKGETPLHTACIGGKMAVVRHLLEQGHPVNIRDHCGWLPLHEACICGHLEIVSLLIEKGAAINDRGGTHCNGMTPLHDAASNGHLQVIALLLDKGASPVSKTDDGETPLHLLKKWHDSVQSLEHDERSLYEDIAKRMSQALEKSGQNDKTRDVLGTNNDLNKKKQLLSQTRNLRRSIPELESPETPPDFERSNTCTSSSESDDNPTQEYRKVMNNLRNKTHRKENGRQTSLRNRPALLTDEDVIDDWLEDDLGQSTKRLKTAVNTYVSTSNLPRNRIERSPTTRKSLTSPLKSAKSPLTIDLTSNHKSQASLLRVGISRNKVYNNDETKSKASPSYSQKHSRQAKLTQFSSLVVEADSTSESQLSRNSSADTTIATQLLNQETLDPMLYVDVRIEGRLYRVPVLKSHFYAKTIDWLAGEAANRYMKKECVKAVLELETKNGAVLAKDDLLSLLFIPGTVQAEEVTGRVLERNVLPISERYKETCNSLNIEPIDSLVEKLECLSVDLNLENAALRANNLAPLLRSLNRQSSLLELNLSGNFLNLECVKLLGTALLSLENLTSLNLSCCGLTFEHLQSLASCVNSASQENVLTSLFSVDLSDNFIGDRGFGHFAAIANKLNNIKALDLSNCNLTQDTFDSATINLNALEVLILRDNELDPRAVSKILQSATNKLKQLDISRNGKHKRFVQSVTNYLSNLNCNNSCALSKLNLSRCNVNDLELFDLISLLERCLEEVNLSYNTELTGVTLRRLLQISSLTKLNLTGCMNILKHFDASLLRDLKASRLASLKISVDPEVGESYGKFVEFWTGLHREKAVIMSSAYFLYLTVTD